MLIAILFLVAVAILSVTAIRDARFSSEQELVNRGAIVSSILSRTATRAVEQPTREEAQAALDRLIYDVRAEEGLEYAIILDRGNRAVAHSDSRTPSTAVPATAPAANDLGLRKGWSDDGFYYLVTEDASSGAAYEFVRPIPVNGKARDFYGGNLELHLGFGLPDFWTFARASLRRIVPGLAIAFLLLVVGNYLAGVLVRPIRTLREETAVAAKAEDDWRLDVEATGEIADIARNWNDMVQNFRTSYERVVQARRDLEVRNRVMLYEKKRTEAIVDSLSDGVLVTDAYGKVSSINRECENLLGVSRDAAVSKAPQDVITDTPIVEFITSVLAAGGDDGGGAAKRNQKRVADVEVQRKNGTRHVRLGYVPVLDSAGKPGGGILTLRDITQDKLEERARKEFVSNVTHELRAPLTAIKSYVEMLIDDEAKSPEMQREFFNTINEEADRLARLIDDMLNMSKIEVGNLVLNKSLVRTRKLLEDAVNGVRSAAKNKSIELTWNIAEDLPDIEADKEMVRVVVTNLLGNGIKYTQEGGKVFCSAEVMEASAAQGARSTIAVTIADNGPGIPEDELDKIFEKFYRGRSTANQKVMGNGLGLALAREIATLHGGDIKVASTVGEGSKFTFLLPACETSRKVS